MFNFLTRKKMPKNNELKTNSGAEVATAKEPMNRAEELKVSQICVSEKTAKYIRLKARLNDFWNYLYDAIEEDYGNVKNFDEGFYPLLNQLGNQIDEYLIVSINETMGEKGVKNLI